MTDNTEANIAAPEPEAQGSSPIDELNARLAEAEIAAATAHDRQLRAVAELENVRKRSEREIANNLKYGSERVLSDLLAIIDSLDLGMKAASAPDANAKSIAEGLALTQKQFHGLFDKYGVAAIDPVGQPFNPSFHEAVSTVPNAEVPPDQVLMVMQKGYRLHDRLLRPAMVIVARAPAG